MKHTKCIYGFTGLAVIIMLICLQGLIWSENNANQEKNRSVNKKSEKEYAAKANINENTPISNQPKDTSVEPSAKNKPDKWDGELHGRGDNQDDEHSGKIDVVGDGNSGNNDQKVTNRQSNSPTVQQSNNSVDQQTNRPVTNVTESKPINNPLGNNRSVKYRVKQEHYKFDRPVIVTTGNRTTSLSTVSSSTSKNNASLTQTHFGTQLTEGRKFLSRAGTNAQVLNQLGLNDPSIIEIDFTVEPIEYSAQKNCHRLKVSCRNLKIHFWDNNISFKYDFNRKEDVLASWNQFYLAMAVFSDESERRLARDRQEKALAVQAVDYHELVHTLGYLALHNRSFMVELSNNNRQINLVDFDAVLDATLISIQASQTLDKIKLSLKDDLLKNIKLLFPEINPAGSTEIKGNRINYKHNNFDKTAQTGNQYGEKDRQQNISYDKNLKIVVNHQEKEESRFLNRGDSNNLQLSQEGRNRKIELISYEKNK